MNSKSASLILLSNIGMRFDNRQILSDVNLQINRGDFIIISGPNGGGKTTLLRILLRLLRPTCGTVDYFEPLRIGYLPQKNSIDSRFPITVREVIASGLLGIRNASERDVNTRSLKLQVDEILNIVELTEHADKPIGSLSGGQLQRTLLGRALISNPSLLVLDEPMSYLDKRFINTFHSLLERLATSTTIIIVSHDLTGLLPLATRHISVDHKLTEITPVTEAPLYQ